MAEEGQKRASVKPEEGLGLKDILQVDFSHFSTVGSWYLISRIADKIFDGIPTAQTEPANNSDAKK